MPAQTVRQQIREYIVANFLFDTGDVEDDASLMGEGIVDSTGVLEVVVFLQERFGIAITEDEVVPESFDTINALAAFVEDKWSRLGERLAG